MSKGFGHRGDPDISPDEFPQAQDGKHVVTGIEKYFSVDDSGNPIYKEINGELKVSLQFRKSDDTVAPVVTLTAPELIVLAEAFGVKINVSYNERLDPTTLLSIREQINESGKTLTVESKNGFARLKMHPPTGLYVVQFKDAYRLDREPDNLNFQTTDMGSVLIFEFEIVGDAAGKASVYNGFPIQWWASNVFVSQWAETDEDGNQVIHECEVPTFDRTTAGGIPKEATRWEKFTEYFAPDVFDHVWERDSLKSSYGVDEVKYPQYVIINEAKKAKKKVLVGTSLNKASRFVFDLYDQVYDEAPETVTPLERVVGYLENVADVELFKTKELPNTLTFTEEGIQWMNDYVAGETGAWSRAELPLEDGKRKLLALSEEQCEALLVELKKQFSEGF